jgi:hypothetical protein
VVVRVVLVPSFFLPAAGGRVVVVVVDGSLMGVAADIVYISVKDGKVVTSTCR